MVLSESQFLGVLALEKRRLERSGRPFVVVQISAPSLFVGGLSGRTQKRSLRLFTSSSRQTDVIGWIDAGQVLGVICTELGSHEEAAAGKAILEKLENLVRKNLAPSCVSEMRLSLEVHASAARSMSNFDQHRAVQLVP
ncbi:MAG: hypothetical protein ABIR70_14580 [Bryobacteraceae bacterium]